ncbi:stromelysin-3-like [Amphiura filiformis]|uniref:stromelysin-3-like n=1 Tax=Amphiura filiformis TaxID=82378 RepID=UPI003B214E43
MEGEHLWRYQGEHVNQRLLTPLHGFPIRRYFKNGPISIDAAFTYKNGSAVFIRGRNMWVFNKRQKAGRPGQYPMRLSKVFGIPRDIDAAYHDHQKGIAYFFKDDQLWKYDTERNRLLTKDSIPASEEFNGFPSPIGGAYSDNHGHRYLISGQRYWQYNDEERNVAQGYPRMFAFLDCH